MAFTGHMHIAPGSLSAVDSAATMPVGTEAVDGSGNRYIYLQGVASTAIGSVVTYDEAGLTTLGVANAVGPIAVAQSASVANKYGWYLVEGSGSALTAGDVVDNTDVYLTATPGAVDDAVVAGDRIHGALFRAARTGAGLVAIQLFSPMVDNIAD
jgi:hypothetical protein